MFSLSMRFFASNLRAVYHLHLGLIASGKVVTQLSSGKGDILTQSTLPRKQKVQSLHCHCALAKGPKASKSSPREEVMPKCNYC